MSKVIEILQTEKSFVVQQRHEVAELLGYETRNKYEILKENGQGFAFAAEQQKGVWNFIVRQFMGHWRSFEVHFFDKERNLVYKGIHPFRFFFNRFELENADGTKIGALQQKFSVFSKRFDVEGPRGLVSLEMYSPIWRIWTFRFFRRNQEVARIEKKWSGALSEFFTDKDNFKVTVSDPNLDASQRALLLAASVFVDLMYFENKAQ